MKINHILFYLAFLVWSFVLLYNMIAIWGITIKQILLLTHLGFFFNFVYLNVQLFTTFGLLNASKALINGMFKFAFSISLMIDIMFWGLYFGDPKHFEQKDVIEPMWYLISMHGSNMIFLFGEHFLICKHEDNKNVGVVIMVAFSTIYSVILYSVFFFLKIEVYPFLKQFSFLEYVMLVCISSIVLILGNYLQKLFVPEEKVEEDCIQLTEL